MKTFKIILLLSTVFLLQACSSIKVSSDYEKGTDFSQFKSFAFYKTGIDKAPISDLDKKRILKSIETELLAKGLVKSDTPDVLVSIFTKAREQINIYEPRWSPYYYNPYQTTQISKYTEGTLFIDLIDSEGKKLIWQGIGSGFLSQSSNPEKREANIQLFVKEILAKYPPEVK